MTMETASTMHSSREESAQPSPTAPLELPRAVQTQPALQVTAPNLPMAPMGPDGLPNLLAGNGEGVQHGFLVFFFWDLGCGKTQQQSRGYTIFCPWFFFADVDIQEDIEGENSKSFTKAAKHGGDDSMEHVLFRQVDQLFESLLLQGLGIGIWFLGQDLLKMHEIYKLGEISWLLIVVISVEGNSQVKILFSWISFFR